MISFVSIWFILAIYWEKQDYTRINNRPPIHEMEKSKKMSELKFYACFNSENNVMWRNLYISTIISYLAIVFVFRTYHPEFRLSWQCSIGVIFFIFLIFYMVHNYRSFHLYRVMSSKIKPDMIIL